MNPITSRGIFVAVLCGMLTACARVSPVPVESVQVTPVTGGDVKRLVRGTDGQAAMVVVWATWCLPCRAEFPDIVRLQRKYRERGLKMVLVSADFESELPAVRQFLADHGVDFPSYIKAEKDMEFINGVHARWSGALPATMIYDRRGELRHFWEGPASYRFFERKVKSVLSETGT